MRNASKKKADKEERLNGLGQRIVRDGTLIGLLVLGAILLVSLMTYSPDDPAFMTTGSGTEVQNAAGRLGALLSDLLLHLFGYLTYLIPLALAFKVYRMFRRNGEARGPLSWQMFFVQGTGLLLLMVGACTLLTLHFTPPGNSTWPAGGLIGAAMAEASVPVLAMFGSTLVYLALFLLGLTITLEISWVRVVDRVGRWTLLGLASSIVALRQWQHRRAERGEVRKVVQRREKAREVRKVKEKTRTPPRIEPVINTRPAPSKRVEKERQGKLFTQPAPGDLPPLSLLDEKKPSTNQGYSAESLEAMSKLLELKLQDFGIEVDVTAVHPGPVITRFEVQPAPGVKASRITGLGRDLARSLAVISVRVVEVIPGKTVIGIEIPNEHRELIMLGEVLASAEFDKAQSPLSMALGHDIVGKPVVVDLGKMPHLLVAGTTGSGKSVGINGMILSLLYKSTPEQVRMIMIDPKMLELSVYDGIPHLLTPVVTDMKDAANALRWSVAEMERRYKLMSAMGVRNLAGFNKKVKDANKAGEPIPDPIWRPDPMALQDDQQAPMLEPLPHIVVVVDELADMMMVVGKKVEELIARIAQKARAAGIHLILATQRPSVDVLTGLIKANIPTRLSFMVQSKVDSRTILGEGGAEQLLGNGDMLLLPPGGGLPKRVHGAFVSDDEVHRVADDWRGRGEPVYIDDITQGVEDREMNMGMSGDGDPEGEDALYDEAVAFVTESRKASISAVQRRLRIGYNRAARMIEAMEVAGVVSEMGTNGSREVLAPPPPR